jgi:asparagine synthase (glutamine-hydrolysing)
MCGIAGILGLAPEIAQKAAPRLRAAMAHRGPDHAATQVIDHPSGDAFPVVLVHARLAILDLTAAGNQPMADSPPPVPGRRRNWLVFNGEIFNHAQLRADLAAAGWPCRSRSDTEVILHAYRIWGEDCVQRMRGMFAWCLVDAERGRVWFCRDRLGIKPLYLYRPAAGGFLFASELRTLLAAGPDLVPRNVNPAALESFLAQGAVYGLDSIVSRIELLAPGQSLWTDWSGRPLATRRYWQVSFAPACQTADGHNAAARRSAVTRLAEGLRDAVKMRLMADVPLGLFLSGGVDSAALATLATEVAGQQVQSLSIGFDDPRFDETEAAAAIAGELGTDHQTLRLTGQDVLDDLPAVLQAVDQPTVDGFNTYFVSQAARRAGLKVALSGLGGDELFGGYASFRDVPRALSWQRRLRRLGVAGLVTRLLQRTRPSRRWSKAAALLRRPGTPLLAYLLRRELFLPADRRLFHPLPEGSDIYSGLPHGTITELDSHADGLDLVNQLSHFELEAYLQHMLLRDADVFSMCHGLELRVPLLDHQVVEQVAGLPGTWKWPDPRPKPLLIDAVGPRLPALAYSRPKRGFTFPWDSWLRGPICARAAAAVHSQDVWSALGWDPLTPAYYWERFLRRDRRVAALQILALVVLEDYTRRHGLRLLGQDSDPAGPYIMRQDRNPIPQPAG